MDSKDWISMEDAVPALNRSVITTDGEKISQGSIWKIDSTLNTTYNTYIVAYQWRSAEPCIFKPTHWMPIPKLELPAKK